MKSRALWVSLLFVALTCVFAYPLPFHLSTHLLATGTDPQLWMWTLAWDAYAFVHQPFAIFDANIFYPAHYSLAYSENLIGSAFIAAPILWLTDNPVLAMNLLELFSAAVCGIGGYVLGRRVGLRPAAAIVTGMIFGFAPARFLRITQFHLTTIEWVPFGLAFLHSYLQDGRARDLRLFVAFLSLQALTSGHGAVFLIVASVLLVVYRLAQGEPVAPVKRLKDLGLPGALLLMPPALVFMAYRAGQSEVPELKRALDDYSVSTASYFASSAHLQQYVLAHLPTWFTTPEADASLFPGYLPVIMALVALAIAAVPRNVDRPSPPNPWRRHLATLLELVALGLLALAIYLTTSNETHVRFGNTLLFTERHPWRIWVFTAIAFAVRLVLHGSAPLDLAGRVRRPFAAIAGCWQARRRDIAVYYGILTLVSFWFTLGPPIGLWRWVYWMPAMSFMRVPSRFVMLEMLGLAVLSGIGFERLTSRLTTTSRAVAATLLLAFLAAEFAAMPLPVHAYRVEYPAVDRWLDTRPKPFVVAEVPLPRTFSAPVQAQRNTLFMLHAMAHWQKTVHGYSGVEPASYTNLYWQIAKFPDEESLGNLIDLGVTYVVMHTEMYRGPDLAAAEERLERCKAWLTLEYSEGTGRVYSIHRPR